MPTFTDAHLTELTERLQAAMSAGDVPIALTREAVRATKPPRARRPSAPKPQADPLVTTIKRARTNVAKLVERIQSARRYIESVKAQGGQQAVWKDFQCSQFYSELPSWQNELTHAADVLARTVGTYFNPAPDTEQNP